MKLRVLISARRHQQASSPGAVSFDRSGSLTIFTAGPPNFEGLDFSPSTSRAETLYFGRTERTLSSRFGECRSMLARFQSSSGWTAWLALSAILVTGLPLGEGSRAKAACCEPAETEDTAPSCCEVVIEQVSCCSLTPFGFDLADQDRSDDRSIGDPTPLAGPCCPCCVAPTEPLPPNRPTRDPERITPERIPIASLPHFSYPERPSNDSGLEHRPIKAPSWTPPYRLTMRFLC
ncbi:hypothetical protein BH23PLA1_BH23PLA1_18830 [soil metagenome]